MPCMDYSDYDRGVIDNTETYKAMRDKLARIACKAMTRLDGLGIHCQDDKEMYEWFHQHKIDDAAAAKRKAEKEKALAEKKRKEREAKRLAEINTLKKLQAKYGRNV